MKIGLIFPHQLFEEIGHFNECNKIYLIEEYLYFKQYPFHKQKIAFQRASMKNYESYLLQQNIEVQYIEATSALSDIRQLLKWLKQNNSISEICYSHTNDFWLEQRIQSSCVKFEIKTQLHASKLFISNANDFNNYASTKKKLLQNDYYIINRKRLNILIENGQPVGGKWSYDDENRLKYLCYLILEFGFLFSFVFISHYNKL
jgi:deoxyribodipyrimidine photolyase-related protein